MKQTGAVKLSIPGSSPYLIVQYYHGYMESELEYNKMQSNLRIGN